VQHRRGRDRAAPAGGPRRARRFARRDRRPAAIGAPSWTRLVVALPASLAASGYIQAQLRFCAGFGSRGVFNFGPLGKTHEVHDPDALARDRARSRQIGLASLAIGAVVAAAAALLPR